MTKSIVQDPASAISEALLIGVRPSIVPLTNNAGICELTGARKSSLSRGMPSTSHTHGKGKSMVAPMSDVLSSRLMRRSRSAVLNALGYAVMRGSVTDVDLALDVFRLNTVAYPESFNTWDSLAEAYMEKGDNDNAVKFYRKSLKLNPENTNATRMIQRMAGKQK